MSHRCRCTSADGTYTYTSTRTSTRVNIYIIYTTRSTPLLQGLCSIDPITATAASSKLAPSAHPRTPTHPVASNGQRDIFFIFFSTHSLVIRHRTLPPSTPCAIVFRPFETFTKHTGYVVVVAATHIRQQLCDDVGDGYTRGSYTYIMILL